MSKARDELPQWRAGRKLSPLLILDEDALQAAVDDLLTCDAFCIDVETTFGHALTNDVLWVGLSSYGRVYLIPMGHPNGRLITPGHVEEVLDYSTVRPYKNNPNRLTKPKKVKQYVDPVYSPPPKQLRPDQVFRILEPLLFSDRTKVNHQLKFDLLSVSKYYGGRIPPGPYVDTVVLSHMLDEHKTDYALKNLVPRRYLGLAAQNPKVRNDYFPNVGKLGVNEFSIDTVASYLAKDVLWTWLMAKADLATAEQQGLLGAFQFEMEVYGPIMRMQQRGVWIDQEVIEARKVDIDSQLRDIELDVWRICGEKFPLTNVTKKLHYLFGPKEEGGQGIKPQAFTKKGQPSTDKKAMALYAGNPLVDLFTQHSDLEKKRQFAETLSDPETLIKGRIHASFNQHRTDTGRLSGSDPNLQQIPRGPIFREAFAPTPGNVMIVADFDQIELRCIAYLARDPEMMSVFIRGDDIHREAAAGVFGVPAEQVTDEQRTAGKGYNFLIAYGGTAMRLAAETGRTLEECEEQLNAYFRRFSRIPPWKVEVIEEAVKSGSRQNPWKFPPKVSIPPFGRVRRIPDLYSDNKWDLLRAQRQAVNAKVQGFASYINKLAMIALDEALAGSGAGLVLNVHDEIVVESPPSEATAVRDIVEASMQGVTVDGKPVLGKVPLVASAQIGSNWYEAK